MAIETGFPLCIWESSEKSRDRRHECKGRVLSQLALLAAIEELAHRLRFPCIPTIKESDGGGEGRLFEEGLGYCSD